MRESINQQFDRTGRVEAIVQALKKVEEEAANEAPRKGTIKSRLQKKIGGISIRNILERKRRRKNETSDPGGENDEEGRDNNKTTKNLLIGFKK